MTKPFSAEVAAVALILVTAATAQRATARVYIYDLSPALPSNPIWCDGARSAQLRPDQFFGLNLRPGKHSFSGRTFSQKIILELTAGKTYYLRLDRVFSYPGGPPSQPDGWYDTLTPQSVQDAGKVLNTLEAIDLRDIFNSQHVTLERSQQ